MFFRPLPWEYAIRNLLRRPLRTLLTWVALTTVTLLLLSVAGFVRGLDGALKSSGEADVALVLSQGMGENLEYSSIPPQTGDLLAASLRGVRQRWGQPYASPELYLGTLIRAGAAEPAMGLVRGLTPAALLVRRQVELLDGQWPAPGQVLVGKLVQAKLAARGEDLAIGQSIEFEGRNWEISGHFAAAGAVFEAELWCKLDDLQQALKRQDLSLVALGLNRPDDFADVQLFCNERLKLELMAMRETDYYAGLQRDYGPVRKMAWLVVLLVAAAGVLAALNTMYGAVLGRVRELATLQTIGFVRRAILLSLVQEGLVLSAAATLAAAGVAAAAVHGAAVRFTMGAFELRIDSLALLVGCGIGTALGLLGAIPPALRVLKMPVVEALKAV